MKTFPALVFCLILFVLGCAEQAVSPFGETAEVTDWDFAKGKPSAAVQQQMEVVPGLDVR